VKPYSSYEKTANLIFPPLSSFWYFHSPVKVSQQKCPLYIYVVIIAAILLCLLRTDLRFAVKQGSGSLLLYSGDGTAEAPSHLQKCVSARLLSRQVEPEGVDLL